MLFSLHGPDGTLFYLLNDRKYNVGRKKCDIIIQKDQSISRQHAFFTVTGSQLSVTDCGAKYNTFVNDAKIEEHVPTTLKDGDVVKFGMLESVYTIKARDIVTACSSLNSHQKTTMSICMRKLGGVVVSNWTPACTHLTVEKIVLTVKTLSAVIEGKPLVTLKYWSDFVESVAANSAPPAAKDYTPEWSEVTLQKNTSIKYNQNRKSVFDNKIFVFPNLASMSKMDSLIELAGGRSISWDSTPLTINDIVKSDKQYVVLQFDQQPSETYNEFVEDVKKSGRRIIALQEIALAIMNCSCEKDCNPNFDRIGILLAKKEDMMHEKNVLVGGSHTQQSQFLFNRDREHDSIIPESMTPVPSLVTEETQNEENKGKRKQRQSTLNSIVKVKRFCIDFEDDVDAIKQESSASPNDKDNRQIETSFTATRNNDTTNVTKTVDTSFSSKRTAAADVEVPQPKKSKTEVTTSFSKIHSVESSRSKTKADDSNPFTQALRRAEKKNKNVDCGTAEQKDLGASKRIAEESMDEENPFKKPKSKPSGPQTSKNVEIVSMTTLQVNISHYVSVTLDGSGKWLSKKDIVGKSIREETDPEVSRITEELRNTAIIVHQPLVVRPVQKDVRNFKKFKKVKPLHPQTRFVPRAAFIEVPCGPCAGPTR